MKKRALAVAIVSGLFLFSPLFILTVNAADIRVNEESVVVDEYVDDDLYVNAGSIEINEDVNGDLVAGGGQIVINDDIYGHAMIGGGTIEINGDIRGSLFVGGGQITVNGRIYEDANIGGGMVTLNGDVDDDVRIGGGTVYIRSTEIGGDLFVGAGNGSVSNDTEVGGDTQVEFGDAQGSKAFDFKDVFRFQQRSFVSILLDFLRKLGVLVGWLIVGYLLFKFAPVKSKTIANTLTDKNSSVMSLVVGVVFMLSLIIIVPGLILLTVLGIGQPLLGLFFSLLAVALTIGGLYSATGLTRMIIRLKKPKYEGLMLPMLIGVTVYQILGWIPWIFCCLGPIVKILITTWGVGGILVSKWNMIKESKGK
ncbi:hypothetical protein JW766_02450 [Candidatus Dojkabacteria bacterium]|nr:hypothetical protein [Candidatus Dojkabacteria bacterium]